MYLKNQKLHGKDQSYVLYSIPRERLDNLLLPLCDFENKDEIRKIAKEHNLPVASKPDSEDICFIPDGNYKKFLEENSNIKPVKGNIVNTKGEVLGTHLGLYRYTIGQRKGLGVSYKEPLFVVGFNTLKNELIVGTKEELYTKEFLVEKLNWLIFDKLESELDVNVKTRYSSNEYKAKIVPEEGNVRVVFDEPQKAITPGQSAVFYIGDTVIGGGKIV